MLTALLPSRRKIWSKVDLMVDVPAPDDPVTEMMGRFLLVGRPSISEKAARTEKGRDLFVGQIVIGANPFDHLACAKDKRGAGV